MSIKNERKGILARIGEFSARHKIVVIVIWIIALATLTLVNHRIGGTYSDNFSLPGTAAETGANLLTNNFKSHSGISGQIVFHSQKTNLLAEESNITKALNNLKGLPDVVQVSDPFTSPGSVAKNGQTALSTVTFTENPANISTNELQLITTSLLPATSNHLATYFGGTLGSLSEPKSKDITSELIGFGVAIVVLLLVFGSLVAAGLPLIASLLAVLSGIALLGVVASLSVFATVSPTLATMIGLGVGIDYSLFLTTRFRQQIIDGMDPIIAAGKSLSTSGRSVLIAAMTVTIALLGLYVSGISFIGKLGLAAAITVITAALAATTLTPAILSIFGKSIDKVKVKKTIAEQNGDSDSWLRWAKSIEKHPWRYMTFGLSITVLLAIPLFSMQLGHISAGANPKSYSDRQAYDLISQAFGPGENGPFTIVIKSQNSRNNSTISHNLNNELTHVANIAKVSPIEISPNKKILTLSVISKYGPQSDNTNALYDDLVNQILPKSITGMDAAGYVTGNTAAEITFQQMVSDHMLLIIGVVLCLAFFILLMSFRSPLLALKAVILNLFSIGAAYGIIVAVFQWGWGGSFIGVDQKVPIESYVPMMMFAITFGLAMDYEVFLLSRIKEAYNKSSDNMQSIADGLARTARVISSAASIMAAVFLAFVISNNIVVKMLGIGLAASVIIDATVIRLMVVPATMTLFGKANWQIPTWLDKILPHLDSEGSD